MAGVGETAPHLARGAREAEPKPRQSEKDAKLAQKLGRLQPFLAVFPQECMGQLGSFWANLTPFSLRRQEIIGAKEAQLLFWLKMGFQVTKS